MTSGERMVFAASIAASSDAGRAPTLAVKAAAMAVQLMHGARADALLAREAGDVDRGALTDDELAMLEDMLSKGANR